MYLPQTKILKKENTNNDYVLSKFVLTNKNVEATFKLETKIIRTFGTIY